MAKKLAREEYLQNLTDSNLFSPEELAATLEPLRPLHGDGETLADRLVSAEKLTRFQADAVRERRFEELVLGNYQVLDRLGAGAMGTVYKARHRRMKRVVAIKVLSRSVAQSEKFVQRFQREVEAAARLSHPNIVMAYDADEAEIGHYLVMEFVNGRDLASEVQKRGPLSIGEAVDCMIQAGRGLDYAHKHGIVHRDIKPANLMKDNSGVVKVADLGLARFNDPFGRPAEEMAALTQAGSIMGTVDFMPPEQAMGLLDIDHRADIYSLGCTLYYILIGCPTFPGPSLMAILLKHREAKPPSPRAARSEVPASLEAIFHRMVAKKPEERFASMAEVVQALEAVTRVPSPTAQPAVPASTISAPMEHGDTTATGAGGQTVDLTPLASSTSALLVEPSRTQAVIIRNYLQALGYSDVTIVPTGQKALEIIRQAAPAVVLSTMHLSDMTGLELANRVRMEAALTNVGFVLISSESDAPEAQALSPVGSIIRLTKPFTAEQLAAALKSVNASSPSATPEDNPDAADQIRVLVVDDSAVARSQVRRVLTSAGLTSLVEARDGAQAVALLEKERFDLVVTDYNMPHLDGRGLIEFIRNQSSTPDVPVILVTTETDPDKLEAVRQLGVAAICEKSFPLEVIRQILKRREVGHV